MKSALAFVLLIGISCHIGGGYCAPDTLYEDLKYEVKEAMDYTADTYNSVMDKLTPSNPLSAPDSLKEEASNLKDSLDNVESEVGDMIKSGMSKLNDAVQSV